MKHERIDLDSTIDARPSKVVKLDNAVVMPTNAKCKTIPDSLDLWFYPPDIANDLKDVNLPEKVKAEALACECLISRSILQNLNLS